MRITCGFTRPSSVAEQLNLSLLALIAGGCATLDYDAPVTCSNCATWNQPQQAFRLFGNTWYVGVAGLSAVLIDTGDGLILIDGGLPQSAPMINKNIRALGFRTRDIQYILVSHAHYDHVGGIAALQRLSGATVLASHKARTALLRGELAADDPQHDPKDSNNRFPAVANVRAVEDQETVVLGKTTITGYSTPGHTPGGMSWAWRSCEGADCRQLVYADSLSPISAAGFRFSDGPGLLAQDLRESAARISNLDCDIFLSNHPVFFDMQRKLESNSPDRFANASACRDYAEVARARLRQRLQQEASR